MNDLHALFVSELKSISDGEQQLVEGLAELERHGVSGEVKRVLEENGQQARSHIDRLHEAFDSVGEEPKRKSCHGVQGILEEGRMLALELEGHSVLDAALLALAEKSQHYKIGAYGSLCTWAEELRHERAASLLKQNLGEAKSANSRLMRLAEAARPAQRGQDHELERLFVRQMRVLLDGENLLVTALAEVEFYAASRLLKAAVHYHLWQTKKHVRRLEKAFSDLNEVPDRRPCEGLEGIIDDAQVIVLEFLGNSALDAGLVASAQKVEHYEMCAYGNLKRWAAQLGDQRGVHLLKDNLSEEVSTDNKLSLVAELLHNRTAKRHETPKRVQETAEFLKLATHGE